MHFRSSDPIRFGFLVLGAAVGLSLTSPMAAQAQSFNIDFGEPGAGPPATYGAAGLAGVWNSIRGEHTTPSQSPQPHDYPLVDLNGDLTGVGLHQFGGTDLIWEPDPSVTGDDAILLYDAIITYSMGLQSCLYINGLENGTYEITTYAWRQNHPELMSDVHHDTNPEHQTIGGAWPGQHEFEITYARHEVEVFNGFLGPHAGLAPGSNPATGGPLNGIQLRLLTPTEVQSQSNQVDEPSLLAVQPNPFTQITAVAFALPESGRVSVTVLDASGRVVDTIANADYNAGRHVIRWDGTDSRGTPVERGVYFARFVSGTIESSTKMVLR